MSEWQQVPRPSLSGSGPSRGPGSGAQAPSLWHLVSTGGRAPWHRPGQALAGGPVGSLGLSVLPWSLLRGCGASTQ